MISGSWRSLAAAFALLGPLCGITAAQDAPIATTSRPRIGLGARVAERKAPRTSECSGSRRAPCSRRLRRRTSMGALVGATFATGMRPPR